MVQAYAPGKAIIFGEHAVVYGHPAVAVAINTGVKVTATLNSKWTVDDRQLNSSQHPHIKWLTENSSLNQPVRFRITSDLHPAAGQGSSAALSVASQIAIAKLSGLATDPVEVSKMAHMAEAAAQSGRASPTDTATSSLGGCVVVARELPKLATKVFDTHLETPEGKRSWTIGKMQVGETDEGTPHLVLGYTGNPSHTGKMVAMVADRITSDPLARENLDSIGEITSMGLLAIKSSAWDVVGMAMDACHQKLRALGLSTPMLEELITAVRPHSLGSKLTGAGGGGCMMALTNEPERVAQTIEMRGGKANVTPIISPGAVILGL